LRRGPLKGLKEKKKGPRQPRKREKNFRRSRRSAFEEIGEQQWKRKKGEKKKRRGGGNDHDLPEKEVPESRETQKRDRRPGPREQKRKNMRMKRKIGSERRGTAKGIGADVW